MVFLFDLFYLALTLGKMHMNPHIILFRFLRHNAHKPVVTGIRSVGSQHKSQPVAVRRRISLLICLIKPHPARLVIAASHQPPADHGTHTGFLHRSGRLMDVHLHIVKTGRPALHHLYNGKTGAPVSIFIRHLLLNEVDCPEQPVHKA